MEKDLVKSKVDWDLYRKDFPITEELTYLNNAAVSPLSTRILNAITEIAKAYSLKGTTCREKVIETERTSRELVAKLINAEPDEIAFTKNTTEGVLITAKGIKWEEGDNVVLPQGEFPANVYPWLSLREEGVEIRMVEPANEKVTAEMLIDSCDSKTKMVSVSAVQFSSGYRIDLKKLSQFCKENGIYLHVDGIQAIGMLDLDVKELGVDFLSSGGQKWLLAASGIGFFYIRKELIEELSIYNPGWLSIEDEWDFFNYNQGYKRDARRFEEGSKNILGISALGESSKRFLEIGMQAIEERVIELSDKLEEGLRERGYNILSPRGEGEKSAIICFNHSSIESEKIFEALNRAGVITSLRLGRVRVSPHFYNNENDIERFFEAIDNITK